MTVYFSISCGFLFSSCKFLDVLVINRVPEQESRDGWWDAGISASFLNVLLFFKFQGSLKWHKHDKPWILHVVGLINEGLKWEQRNDGRLFDRLWNEKHEHFFSAKLQPHDWINRPIKMKWQINAITKEEFEEAIKHPPSRPIGVIGKHPGGAYRSGPPLAPSESPKVTSKRPHEASKAEPSLMKKAKIASTSSASPNVGSLMLHSDVRELTLASLANECDLGENHRTQLLRFKKMWDLATEVAMLAFDLSKEQVRSIRGKIAAVNEKARKDGECKDSR